MGKFCPITCMCVTENLQTSTEARHLLFSIYCTSFPPMIKWQIIKNMQTFILKFCKCSSKRFWTKWKSVNPIWAYLTLYIMEISVDRIKKHPISCAGKVWNQFLGSVPTFSSEFASDVWHISCDDGFLMLGRFRSFIWVWFW